MRATTFASIVLLGLSGAAIAQVAGAPIEQKSGGNDMAAPVNSSRPPDTAPANAAQPDNAVDSAK